MTQEEKNRIIEEIIELIARAKYLSAEIQWFSKAAQLKEIEKDINRDLNNEWINSILTTNK